MDWSGDPLVGTKSEEHKWRGVRSCNNRTSKSWKATLGWRGKEGPEREGELNDHALTKTADWGGEYDRGHQQKRPWKRGRLDLKSASAVTKGLINSKKMQL